jgi:outer membrane lipoprotein-sorting protein
MRFLRTVSTQRLLAIIAGLVIAVAGGTAIAVAAAGSGPLPPRESLAQALHQAASAPSVTGITARISFTNNLIDSTDLQGTDPILSGATGRLWLSPASGELRLELQGNNGDAQVVVKNGTFSIYDPMTNTVYKGTLPSQGSGSSSTDKKAGSDAIPSVADIQTQLKQLIQHVDVAGPFQRNVAGQPAYKIKLTPKHSGGLLGDVQLAWDASHGVPLGIAIYSTSSSTPVLELKATDISYGKVSAKDFKVSAPSSAKVVRISTPATHAAAGHATFGKAAKAHGKSARGKHATTANSEVIGVRAVQAHLPFRLAAPMKLDGLGRQSVSLLDWGGTPASLTTYGQGLGGIAVIEQTASGQSPASSSGSSQNGGGSGLTLPTASINGNTAQELATALGTVLRVKRGNVEYTLIGSVPPTAAEMAARALVP